MYPLVTPFAQSIIIIKSTWISYIVVFPVATLLISIILDVQKEAIIQRHIIKNQQKLLQTSIDSTTTMEIYSVDQNLNYITFNNFHREQIKRFYNIDIKTGDSFLDNIEDDKMRIRLEKQFVRALNGETLKEINEVETKKGDFLEETFTPIEDENNSIFGVTVFSENITERYKQQQNIIHMSYHDALTGLKNRRFFQELIIKLDNINNYPLSIVFCDINGLKIINDTFGHLTGDETIKVTARELNKIFGKNNFYVSRIGGDEFAILMPKTTNAKARKLIDIAKSNIDNIKIKSINATVSFGLATKTNHQSLNDIIKYAENEMYAHKLSEASSQRSKIIDTIMNTLLAKNPREKIHSDRVADICVAIGSEMNMSSDDLKMLKIISNLHDIGKIAINDKILNKPGKLTNEEWDEIKRHPEIGYRILSSIPEYARIAEDILSHHENYDGKGYPRGLKGEEIPIRARIIALADAYDAMISDRPYRKGMSHLDAIKEIKRCRGMQFDPNVTDIFLKLYE